MIDFTIPGQPVAKGRPKFARRGNHVTAYTPEKTQSYENLVKLAASQAMAGGQPYVGPVQLDVYLGMQIPASWSKLRQRSASNGRIAATKKPDADNVLKAIKDGCNGIVWRDDAQVVQLSVRKCYDLTPRAIVCIRELEGEAA